MDTWLQSIRVMSVQVLRVITGTEYDQLQKQIIIDNRFKQPMIFDTYHRLRNFNKYDKGKAFDTHAEYSDYTISNFKTSQH